MKEINNIVYERLSMNSDMNSLINKYIDFLDEDREKLLTYPLLTMYLIGEYCMKKKDELQERYAILGKDVHERYMNNMATMEDVNNVYQRFCETLKPYTDDWVKAKNYYYNGINMDDYTYHEYLKAREIEVEKKKTKNIS